MMKARDVRTRICLPVGETPIVELSISVNKVRRQLRLKLESYNPCGSLKDRVAAALIDQVVEKVDPDAGIIESTSGNLGVAMAAVCKQYGIRFNAVMDPRASPLLMEQIRWLGAQVTVIDQGDSYGGYLLNRIRYVHDQLVTRAGLIWTNQYENKANPDAHFASTAPELWRQVPGPATVLVPVSTGGTLAGLMRFASDNHIPWRLIGVDVNGSVALGRSPGRRLLSGIGASCPSSFLDPAAVEALYVSAAEAISACLWLSECAGIDVGGSSGAAIAAALRLLRNEPGLTDLACICPDGADRYVSTIYQVAWRNAHDIADAHVGDDAELLHVQYRN